MNTKRKFKETTSKKLLGQGMVEFMIALPILLFVIFGIIEFARLSFAWMAVQNAARFAIRYAVTGEFNEIYCVEAGNQMGATHVNADTFGGDPQDCDVPDTYTGIDGNDLERDLIDLARLFSIRDAASGAGSGLWLDPAITGDYEQYLINHDPTYLGQTDAEGYFHVTICSNRFNQYAVDYNNYSIPLCMDNLNVELMDDAGGPGDRVKVHIEHQHPMFLPLLSNIWPSVPISGERDGIVERFRVSRVLGVSGPILSAPTWTMTPTVTDTPTITPSPTDTPTTTPTLTPTVTNTPIPVDCDLISVITSYAGHWMSGYHITSITIQNDNPVPIHLYRANQTWQKNNPGRYLWATYFYNSGWAILNDMNPDTTWDPFPAVTLPQGAQGEYLALYMPRNVPLEGDHTIDLVFDDGCHKGVTVDMATSTPTATPTNTPTPTATPLPDCSQYQLSNFSFRNGAVVRATFRNRDVVSTNLTSLELNWDYAEALYALNGEPNLNVDWFKWAEPFSLGMGMVEQGIFHLRPSGMDLFHLLPEQTTDGTSILMVMVVGMHPCLACLALILVWPPILKMAALSFAVLCPGV